MLSQVLSQLQTPWCLVAPRGSARPLHRCPNAAGSAVAPSSVAPSSVAPSSVGQQARAIHLADHPGGEQKRLVPSASQRGTAKRLPTMDTREISDRAR
jgi:hypothetical protein